ncbi:MAG TPA: hypothetical protein VF288_00730 [Mycobacteriales bacterium]
MRRPASSSRRTRTRRTRLLAAVAGSLLAATLGLVGAVGLSGPGIGGGSGHGVHTDIQSWS